MLGWKPSAIGVSTLETSRRRLPRRPLPGTSMLVSSPRSKKPACGSRTSSRGRRPGGGFRVFFAADAAAGGSIPLVLGGDHSVALGTLAGLRRARGLGGVLWLDAHGDLNSPATSPSGNVHGMVLAAALGFGGDAFADGWDFPAVDAPRMALVGVRSLDDGERELLGRLDAKVFMMSDVDRLGVERAIRESLAHVAGPGFVHVSLDMDVVDPEIAPGVGTPVRGGLNYREAHLALELVAESGLASSLDVVEVNPILDRENQTALLAVELAASALGARIL